MGIANVDGALVGGASLKAEGFTRHLRSLQIGSFVRLSIHVGINHLNN